MLNQNLLNEPVKLHISRCRNSTNPENILSELISVPGCTHTHTHAILGHVFGNECVFSVAQSGKCEVLKEILAMLSPLESDDGLSALWSSALFAVQSVFKNVWD